MVDLQQNEVLLDLETALDHQNDKVDYVNSLVGANANIYHSYNLTKYEQYKTLNEVSVLIDDFILEK